MLPARGYVGESQPIFRREFTQSQHGRWSHSRSVRKFIMAGRVKWGVMKITSQPKALTKTVNNISVDLANAHRASDRHRTAGVRPPAKRVV